MQDMELLLMAAKAKEEEEKKKRMNLLMLLQSLFAPAQQGGISQFTGQPTINQNAAGQMGRALREQ